MGPLATTKTPKVGVALALIVVTALDPTGVAHCPVDGKVWHSDSAMGRVVVPVSAVTVMEPRAPTLTVAAQDIARGLDAIAIRDLSRPTRTPRVIPRRYR